MTARRAAWAVDHLSKSTSSPCGLVVPPEAPFATALHQGLPPPTLCTLPRGTADEATIGLHAAVGC